MTELRALLFADWRGLVNDARRALRSPGRIALWTTYLALLAFFIGARVLRHARGGGDAHGAELLRADYFVCALLVLPALGLASGRGAIGIFRSRAEARFIIASPVGAPLAIGYLQVREGLAQGLRLLFSFVYLIFVFGPRQIGLMAALADVALVLAIVSAAAAVVVPRRLLSGPAAVVCVVAGGGLAILALFPAVRDVLDRPPLGLPLPEPLAHDIVAALPAWHPGQVFLEPNLWWLLAAFAVAGAAIAVLASSGRDAYPELYALSIARIERAERRRSRGTGAASARAAGGPGPPGRPPAPAGVLVLVWKSLVEFGRQRPAYWIAGGAAAWCGAGFAAARLAALDAGTVFAAMFGVGGNVILIVGVTATTAIAGEVRRPLFWLSQAALFERLCALAAARVWRPIVTLELVAAGFALGGGGRLETVALAIGLPALVALLAGVGFAAFALFPSSADWRGPIAALRLLVSTVLLVPPLAIFSVAAIGFDAALPGLVAAALLALIEAGALIGVAAWRLDGHVDRLAA